MTTLSASNSALLRTYRAQVDALEAAPGVSQAYKDSLEAWYKAMQQSLGESDTPAPAPSPSPSPSPSPNPAPSPSPSSVPGGTGPLGANAPAPLKALEQQIAEASRITGVPENLLAAQIWQESRGVSNASSSNPGNGMTDSGLMQVNPATFGALQQAHPELQGRSLSDPATNILAGAFYMKDMKQQFGSWELALRAYNSGPGSVDVNDPNRTTTGLGDPTYVQKVVQYANDLQNGTSLPA